MTRELFASVWLVVIRLVEQARVRSVRRVKYLKSGLVRAFHVLMERQEIPVQAAFFVTSGGTL